MPRGVRKEKENDVIVGEPQEKKEVVGETKVVKIGHTVLLPYTGKENLPAAKINNKGVLLKKGEPRFFCNGNETNGFKLIMIRRSAGNRVQRICCMVIKPKIKNPAHRHDREIYLKLKKAGIPGVI